MKGSAGGHVTEGDKLEIGGAATGKEVAKEGTTTAKEAAKGGSWNWSCETGPLSSLLTMTKLLSRILH